ncbi:MAG: cell division protein FtsB [Pseudomonadota bacterium]|mgnify:FL=1
MKFLAFLLLLLIAVLQHPLWYGKGSWLEVWEVDQEVSAARENNRKLQNRNTILQAEVNDLKQGFDAIEERARSDLGMIKQDEILFQIVRTTQPKNGVTR